MDIIKMNRPVQDLTFSTVVMKSSISEIKAM
jgi:hypothetical protein